MFSPTTLAILSVVLVFVLIAVIVVVVLVLVGGEHPIPVLDFDWIVAD